MASDEDGRGEQRAGRQGTVDVAATANRYITATLTHDAIYPSAHAS